MSVYAHEIKAIYSLRAQDLSEIGYFIQPFFIERDPDKPFDSTKFYQVCLQSHVSLSPDTMGDYTLRGGEESYADLLGQIRLLQTPKRAAFSVPFVIGEGLTIGIQG